MPKQPFGATDNNSESTTPFKFLADGVSRRAMFRRAGFAAVAIAPLSVLAACGSSAATSTSTSTSAVQTAMLAALPAASANKAAFTEIQADEDAHVQYLVNALKSNARPKPTFKNIEQADITSFAATSRALENVGVGAYLMAAPAISDKSILAAAGSILTIEARHAGFLDVLTGQPISPNGAFDKPLSQSAIVAAASPFIASLNGGSDPSMPLTNDLDILNFALLLEYLEAEYYDTNVPKFFS